MILFHHPDVELSRNLAANAPAGVEVRDCTGGPGEGIFVSAYPSVSFKTKPGEQDVPEFNQNGELTGVSKQPVPGYVEMIRLPASWDAVAAYVAWKGGEELPVIAPEDEKAATE